MNDSATTNPYQTPSNDAIIKSRPNLIGWCVAIVVGTSLICGVLGMIIGYALGKLLPGYYRSVFNAGDNPSFDPTAVGIGLGLTQGIMFGAFVGLASFGLYYWLAVRSVGPNSSDNGLSDMR